MDISSKAWKGNGQTKCDAGDQKTVCETLKKKNKHNPEKQVLITLF